MGKNNKWKWALFLAAAQAIACTVVVTGTYTSANELTLDSLPGWWKPMVWIAICIGPLGFGLMLVTLNGYNKDVQRQLSDQSKELQRTQTAIVFGLAKLSESRDTDTGDHLDRIRKYVSILAKDLSSTYRQLDETAIRNLGLASSLHDIGKVGIPDSILLKPGSLSDGERKVMEYHATIGGECLEAILDRMGENSFLETAKEIAWFHHERWDGQGYPHRLSKTDIPLSARIVAVADVYDALTSKRPYKKARTHAESREILLAGRCTQFDPSVVDAFLRHESEFEAVSLSQRDRADEDCISGLQRISEAVDALQRESSNLLHAGNSIKETVNSTG